MSKWFGQSVAALLVLAAAGRAHASHMGKLLPDHLWIVGASVADGSTVGATDQPVIGLDATYTASVFWASLGARLAQDRKLLFVPYAEVGAFVGINVGGGISVLTNTREHNLLAPHLFLGMPLPLKSQAFPEDNAWVIEPYYRPTYWGGNVLHELGFLLKVAWEPGQSSPRARPMPVVARPPAEPPLVDPAKPGKAPAP